MLISCCTVTQAGREAQLERSIGDFAAQTHPDRELLIVHDGDPVFDACVRELAQGAAAPIRVRMVAPGRSLGELRNVAVDVAQGDWLCQWDDDDRYHPQRLALQARAVRQGAYDFCFLVDQLHWFPDGGDLFWDDWNIEPYPMNFVPGTVLGRRTLMPRYPALRRGEDSALALAILRAGHRVARLRGVGWCYTYVFHGGNTFGAAHHAAITRLKSLRPAQMLARERLLRARLAEYQPPLTAVRLRAGEPLEGQGRD